MDKVFNLIIGVVAFLLAAVAYQSYATGISVGLFAMVFLHYITTI